MTAEKRTYEEYSKEEHESIQNNLQKSLGPEWLSQRSGPSGRLTYIEGRTAISIANEIFGFNGWSSCVKDCTVDYVDVTENGRYNVGVSVSVRITLKDGTYHEDVGYGSADNSKTKSMAFEKARKQAVTDATKRTLRCFGNALGNCLYDKVYLAGIGQMAHPQIKFSPKNLYRHNQYQTKALVITPSNNLPIKAASKSSSITEIKKTENISIHSMIPPKQEPRIETTTLRGPIVHEDSFHLSEGDEALFAEMFDNYDGSVHSETPSEIEL